VTRLIYCNHYQAVRRRAGGRIDSMDLQLLDQTLADRDEPRFRARQVWAWAARGANGYEEMTDLPASLRETLERELPFSSLELRSEARASDGTVKALFATADGRPLEAVLMRYRDGRRSICVSSQSGCPLTCTFCATGRMRFARNLTASEIIDQALHFRRIEGPARRELQSRPSAPNGALQAPIGHCVFMGMGEPMLNIENVLAACERLPDLGIGHRRTAISTVGWIPGIERLTEQDMPLRLALSLHAADEALRSELMPVNERFPLSEVIDACRAFYARKRRRVFVEYVMLAGVNDRYEQALALARVLSSPREDEPSIFKVNLIPYNPTDSPYRGSTRESIAAFRSALQARGIAATVRLTRGRDIDAACGQLAALAG
jgi:23S rRNA (adenine2503-C2)-methyltransferase